MAKEVSCGWQLFMMDIYFIIFMGIYGRSLVYGLSFSLLIIYWHCMRLHDVEKYCQPFDTVIVDGGSDVLDTMIIHSVLDKIEHFGIWCGRTANK